MNERGKLIVVSGPSGSGKSTVISKLFTMRENLHFSISATTRKAREGEKHGVHYFFVSKDEFLKMIASNELLEHAEYVGNYYGTPTKAVLSKLEEGIDVILDIETKGAAQIKEKMPECVTVFLMPPKFSELSRRLHERSTDSEEVIANRLEKAVSEYKLAANYDYIVINDVVDDAAMELLSIITAEKCRAAERLFYTDVNR